MILIGKRTPNKDFIEFRNGFGCFSITGRDGGRQALLLASYCAEETTLIHEVNFVIYQNTESGLIEMYYPQCEPKGPPCISM